MATSLRTDGGQAVTRVGVTVTFLRMDQRPEDAPPPLPQGATIRLRRDCTVAEYRSLYNGVGADHVWWLRRVMSDRDLHTLLSAPTLQVYVIEVDGVAAGFHELDRSAWPVVNLSYFGLLPHAVGRGLGPAFLRHAIDTGFAAGAQAMTVNTCTADHPRALPTYLRAGFKPVRSVEEVWQVPRRLQLHIPERLRR